MVRRPAVYELKGETQLSDVVTMAGGISVAAALGEECPDHWQAHLDDTLAAGRGLCYENLASLLCREAPARIREMQEWRVGWARRQDGRIAQVTAPGHSRPRCCYVDFLNTGPAVAATLRRQIGQIPAIKRVSNLAVTDLAITAYSAGTTPGIRVADGAARSSHLPLLLVDGSRLTRRNSAVSSGTPRTSASRRRWGMAKGPCGVEISTMVPTST